MKAIASVALAAHLTEPQIMAAGFLVAIAILLLGITQTIHYVYTYVSLPVIRGIQMGTGFILLTKGCSSILSSGGWIFTKGNWMDNYLIAIICFVAAIFAWNLKNTPTAFILFSLGLVISGVKITSTGESLPKAGTLNFPTPAFPSLHDFKVGFLSAALGQIPLTALNSVIATSRLADDLFPDKPHPVASTVKISISLATMNLVGCFFGSTPYCHGSGGLAGQYRFGARSHVSIWLLGCFKILAGLIFGESLAGIFKSFPKSILGILLLLAGAELCSAARDVGANLSDPEAKENFVIMMFTMGGTVGFSNDGIGFLAGILVSIIFGVYGHSGKGWHHGWQTLKGKSVCMKEGKPLTNPSDVIDENLPR